MENAFFVSLSRQTSVLRQMDVIANNIANSSTMGFKSEKLMFVEYLSYDSETGPTSYVQDVGVIRDFREGALNTTGNDLDFAINGPGWFTVDTPDGPRYTRDGRFRINEDGLLSTLGGHPVLDTNGNPLAFEEDETDIEVTADGAVSTSQGEKGEISMVVFDEAQKLRKEKEGLYTTDQPPRPATAAALMQGMLEGSNVEPIIEITNMIQAMRSYQSAQRFIESGDELRRAAIRILSKAPEG